MFPGFVVWINWRVDVGYSWGLLCLAGVLLFFVTVCLIAISYLGAVDVFGICCLLCCFAR